MCRSEEVRRPALRKRLVSPPSELQNGPARDQWLDLESTARVEVSSEDPASPIEAALLPTGAKGWRAAEPGRQTIRIVFDRAQHLRRIALVFEELRVERSQEFTLRWWPEGEQTPREIVRQQWNFTPTGSVREVEDYRVDLMEVAVLELEIVPDRSHGPAHASLTEWRLA